MRLEEEGDLGGLFRDMEKDGGLKFAEREDHETLLGKIQLYVWLQQVLKDTTAKDKFTWILLSVSLLWVKARTEATVD